LYGLIVYFYGLTAQFGKWEIVAGKRRTVWGQAFDHFSRDHESVRMDLAAPVQPKGKQLSRKDKERTPALAAGFTNRPWTGTELIRYPVY
jgi:hypothetical protein